MVGYVWFVWPVTLTSSGTVIALLLYLNAVRNGRSPEARAVVIGGSILTFALPAVALAVGMDIGCSSDTGMSVQFGTPVSLLIVLVGASSVALYCLTRVSGGGERTWLIPLILLGIGVPGFVVETVVGFTGISAECEFGNPVILYTQGGLSVLLSIAIPVVVLRTRRYRESFPSDAEVLPTSTRAW